MDKYYYKVFLELWRENELFGMINISHIPYNKFEELFKDQIINERFLFDDVHGYFITNELYTQHKEFFDKEILVKFNFTLFEYVVGLSGGRLEEYQKDYYDELPVPFKK